MGLIYLVAGSLLRSTDRSFYPENMQKDMHVPLNYHTCISTQNQEKNKAELVVILLQSNKTCLMISSYGAVGGSWELCWGSGPPGETLSDPTPPVVPTLIELSLARS